MHKVVGVLGPTCLKESVLSGRCEKSGQLKEQLPACRRPTIGLNESVHST